MRRQHIASGLVVAVAIVSAAAIVTGPGCVPDPSEGSIEQAVCGSGSTCGSDAGSGSDARSCDGTTCTNTDASTSDARDGGSDGSVQDASTSDAAGSGSDGGTSSCNPSDPNACGADAWCGDRCGDHEYHCRPNDPLDDKESYCWLSCPGSGSGSGSGSQSMAPACGATYCTRYYQEWALVHSNYNVNNTWGNGEHQGLGVRTFWKTYDPRFGNQVCSTNQPSTESRPGWGAIASYMWNHGRTVNTMPGTACRTSSGGANACYRNAATTIYKDTTSWQRANTHQKRWSNLASCFAEAGTDSMCDTRCLNDGYTLPRSAQDTSATAISAGNDMFTMKAYLIPRSGPPLYGRFPPGGTYALACANPGSSWPSPIPCADTPQAGHNSNNDANAERAFFSSCASAFSETWDRSAAYTSVCGAQCDGLAACRSTTNIAAAKVGWCSGCMNLADTTAGDVPGTQPRAGYFDSTAIPTGCSGSVGNVVNGI